MNEERKADKLLALSAAVLAGGDSKRMGKNKAFLELGGERLIDLIVSRLSKLFAEVFVVTNDPGKLSYLPVRLEEDIYKQGEKNSLRGIHTALNKASYFSCFVTACDMPFISLSLIKYMSDYTKEYDLVTPKLDGYYQPMFSFYNKKILPVIDEALMKRKYKITSLFKELKTKEIFADIVSLYDPKQLSFININSPEIFRWAEAYIQGKTNQVLPKNGWSS